MFTLTVFEILLFIAKTVLPSGVQGVKVLKLCNISIFTRSGKTIKKD